MTLLRAMAREVLYRKWVLSGYVGRNVPAHDAPQAICIIQSYRPERMRNVAPLVRCLLKCDFIEKIIVSNNNPRLHIHDWVRLRDGRVTLVNQPVRRGCGYRWIIAGAEGADYFIAIDDDCLLYPAQFAALFRRLVERPEVPHGLAGLRRSRYVQRYEGEVDVLYNVFAVTRAHVAAYLTYVEEIVANEYAPHEAIEFWGDDVIMSQTGAARARVHDVGRLSWCRTAFAPGVALHKEAQFELRRNEVSRALEMVKPRHQRDGRQRSAEVH
ncbi:MAG: hypothetical protein ACRD9R_04765 [Pyrinomonadaceae bacterium]